MKKIFSLFAAALMSAVMFAGDLVPGDNILWTKGDATEVFGEGTNANGNKWRDLAYYNGVVYAIAHSQDASGNPRIYKFDAETGSYLGNMDVSAVWGGDIPLTSLQILDNGEVIAMGCRVSSASSGVPIYYWDSVQGVSHELMRATIANGGKRVEMLHYEGTLADGKIYLAAEQCDKITVIPVVNKAVVTDEISYITLTSGTDYIGFAPRVIDVNGDEITICSSTKAMTYKISDGSCLTWTDLTGANQEGGDGVAFFEYNNEKYWATVKMGNVSAATLANACVQVQTYTGLGRWGASGVVQKYCSAADLLPSEVRNTSFTTGLAVRVNEDGYSVWACSVNQGIIAYRYVAPVDYNIKVNTTAAGDFQITSANCTDVLNDGGSFKFDNATKTITLTNCHFTSDTYPLTINQSVNIVLVGENSITSTISATALKFASGDATIGGGGKLTLSCVNTGGADGIYCPGGNLTINECEIYAEGGYGIEGGSTRTLTINPGAKVTAYGPNRGSFTGWSSIVLGEGVEILSPAGAQIVGGDVKDAEGALLKSQVVIGVPAEETIPATSVALDKDTLKMFMGVPATLKATVLPENTTDFVEWSIVAGGESFVSVLAGTITALAEGEAKVVAKAGEVADTCVVVVGPAPVEYGIQVYNPAEVGMLNVNSANCADIFGDGKLSYEPTEEVLTLNNFVMDCGGYYGIINNTVDGLTIKLLGENVLTAHSATALRLYTSTTITGGGKLTASSENNDGCYISSGTLTIDSCELVMQGKWGLEGNGNALIINEGAHITAIGTSSTGNSDGSIKGYGSITLNGVQILSPEGAQIINGTVCDAAGATLTTEVVIGTPAPVVEPTADRRIFAYDLRMAEVDEVCTFAFKTNIAPTAANIVFYNEGVIIDRKAIEVSEALTYSVDIAKASIAAPEGASLTWGVEVRAGKVEEMADFLKATAGDKYNFYLMQGWAFNNCTESAQFGNSYITVIRGLSDGNTDRTKFQPGGIYVFDAAMESLDAVDNVGFAQALLPAAVNATERQDFKRISIDPMDGMIYFNSTSAIYKIDPADTAHYTNILEGKEGITKVNCCYALNGNVYFMDNANTSDGGTLKMIDADGNITSLIQSPLWGVQDMSITTDGHGGFWLAQHRWNADAYSILTHVNTANEIDYSVTSASDAAIKELFPQNNNASYRGQCAYNEKEDLLAFGGNKTVAVYHVTYDAATGVPSLELVYRTGAIGSNIDGLAFDFAGNLLVASASTEMLYMYSMPIDNNEIITPAAKSQVIEMPAAPAEPVYALNPYAFGVSASSEGEVITINYSLNVDAAEVYAQLFDGETMVASAPLAGITKGAHTETVDVSEAGLPVGTYTGKIAVVGVAHEFTTYADSTVTFNNRYHATVDANPMSPNFGNIYGACRYSKVGIFRITPDYTYLNTEPAMIGQASWASVQRGAVAPNGEMWFSSWGDATSGIYRYDPSVDADASTQFFIGTRNASTGLITNNGEEVGCSTPGIAIYSAGKDSKLYLIGEDFSDGSTKGSLAIYNIGQEDGSIVTSWDKAPSAHYNTLTDKDGTNFAMAATPYGVWICQNRAVGANIPGARSLQFIGNDGVQRYLSTDTELINGSYGAGIVTNDTFDKLWMVDGRGDIMQFSVEWTGEGEAMTPSLTLDATYETPFGAIAQMTFDFAGNIVAVGGTGNTPYSNNASVLRLAVFSLPAIEAPVAATPVVGFEYVVAAPAAATLAEVLDSKTIRRAVACDDAVYVLAIDDQKAPTLVKADFEGNIMTEYATDFCTVSAAAASEAGCMVLSDIALTADGVLVGINAEHAHTTKVEGTQPIIYKWNADGSGAIWINTDDLVGGNENFAAGNFGNATVDMIAYSGTIADGEIVMRAMTQGSGNRSRFGIMKIVEGAFSVATRNQDLTAFTATSGITLIAAPTKGNYIWSGAGIAPIEWTPAYTETALAQGATPTLVGTMANDYIGIKDFSVAKSGEKDLMIIPAEDGATILNVTSGLATATVEEELSTQGITCGFMHAALVADGAKVMLMRDADIILLDMPAGPGTNLNEVKAAAKAVKVMRNGHVFIIRDGKMFNMQGMMVK